MPIVVGKLSALQLMRPYALGEARCTLPGVRERKQATKKAVALLSSGAAPTLRPEAARELFGNATPIQATVSFASARNASKGIHASVRKGPFHPQAFIEIRDGIYASTPEMIFCEMAGGLSLERLILLGFQLCGTYYKCIGETIYNTVPLTSPDRIKSFIAASPRFKGSQLACRAIDHVIANSASPRESMLAMMLCLPYSLGGYGIPHPEMNAPVHLPRSVRATGRASLRCDLFWPQAKFDVEYDSASHHAAERSLSNDSIRRIALESMGITSINITPEHMRRAPLFDEAAHGIARILGKRIRTPHDFTLKQEHLWNELRLTDAAPRKRGIATSATSASAIRVRNRTGSKAHH